MATTTPIAITSTGSSPSQVASKTSTEDDKNLFLKLMVEQLKQQDPMNPTDGNQWLTQMAQFNSVEQLTNLASSNANSQAVGLLGKTVSYQDGTGSIAQGAVSTVSLSQSGPTLTVGDTPGIQVSSLTEVQ